MKIIRTITALVAATFAMLLALPLLLCCALFWPVAKLTQILADRMEPSPLPWNRLVEYDREVGWIPKPNLDVHYLAVRDPEVFHVVTDGEGWPGRATIAESSVVVFGDSLAFGFGVDSKDAFAHVRPELSVKVIAAPGYNNVQELLLLKKFAGELSGKLVVWFLYFGNDLYDNLQPAMSGYRTPFLRQVDTSEGWEIVTRHMSPDRWHSSSGRAAANWSAELASLHSPGALSQRAFSACEYLISEGQKVCSRSGAQLIVLGIPTPRTMSPKGLSILAENSPRPDEIQADLPDRELRRICENHGVTFVSARNHLSIGDYRPVDDHWNEKGHRRIADLLLSISKQSDVPMAESAVA